jgi:serine O-acetyltransferase
MIRNFKDLKRYQREDLAANGLARWRWWDRFGNPAIAFERKLRRTEFVLNTLTGPKWKFCRAYSKRSLRMSGLKLGFTIPPNVFGPGLSLPHWGTIVINPKCRVGARCRMHPGVSLGWHDGKVPKLGDDCYLGPGAKLYGGVVLGNKTKVGPNAVVCRSYPEGGAVLVAPREYNVRQAVVERKMVGIVERKAVQVKETASAQVIVNQIAAKRITSKRKTTTASRKAGKK